MPKLNTQARSLILFSVMLLAGSLLTTSCSTPQSTSTAAATSTTTTTAATTAAIPTPTPELGPPSEDHPAVALTFDDGPSLLDTGTLLDLLAAENVKVTFFVLGGQIDAGRKDLLKREFAEGHEIGNHTYEHLTLKKADAKAVRDELSKASDLIEQVIGQKPTLMRPPTGAFDDTTKAVCLELGLSIVNWSWQSCPEDWNHRGEPDLIANYVIENAANGHIILLHDTNSTTVEAMPKIIKGLKERGFRFMTVSELLAYQGDGAPAPGEFYAELK